ASSLPSERDAMDDGRYGPLERIRAAAGDDPLRWLVNAVDACAPSFAIRNAIWTALAPYIDVMPGSSALTRTFCRGLAIPVHHRPAGLRERIDAMEVMRQPIGPALRLDGKQRKGVVEAARGVLIGHLRETDTVSLAGPDHVELFDMGEGIAIALLTLPPERRSLYDSYIGYVAFSNSVPVAYGGAWVFPGKSKVGINVFPAFRGGPSTMLFAQILRCYAQHYDIGRFEADNYQLGHANPDGIRSGAYWFYHKLGFRTMDVELAEVAERERALMSKTRSYRSPATVLRRLVAEPMWLDLRDEHAPITEPIGISEEVLRRLGRIGTGDRERARELCVGKVMRATGVKGISTWPPNEQEAFRALAPVISMIEGLEQWSGGERRALIALMRSKGGATEREFISALRSHPRLLNGLHALAASHC
ncbi:MAG TPA: hypothetical protein PK760_09170, partial [Flavobacteriales bacterium]|nr:hypothetical protein [Flavobacteriales bacterium]